MAWANPPTSKTVQVALDDYMLAAQSQRGGIDVIITAIQQALLQLTNRRMEISTHRDPSRAATVIQISETQLRTPVPPTASWSTTSTPPTYIQNGFPLAQYVTSQPKAVYLDDEDDPVLGDEPESMWQTEPIVGWKFLQVLDKGVLASPISRSHRWDDGQLVAECRHRLHGDEKAPAWECECGIYASSYPVEAPNRYDVLAEIALTGKIIEHEYGYRAEKAKILRLWASKEFRDALAERYKVPVMLKRKDGWQ